jgi:hypothetical protein
VLEIMRLRIETGAGREDCQSWAGLDCKCSLNRSWRCYAG